MKSSNFFIKSNYIKNAKDRWIFCEGRLLYHQNITFLHLKSLNIDRNSSDCESNCSEFSTLSQMQRYQRSRSKDINRRLNVLCNLGEFKSCEIKSVNFEYVNKFAIKLVPSGFFSNKKLYLLPDLEDCLTEWCGLLTGFVTKSIHFPIIDSAADDQSAMTLSSTIRATRETENNNTFASSKDVFISLDENDAYEATNHIEFYLVRVESSEDSMKLNMHGRYLMKLGLESLELLNPSNRDSIHTFPYSSIRRFGAKDSMFRIEAGRHCSTGFGCFTFQVKEAAHIAEKVKENARQLKTQKSVHSSCMTLSRPSMYDVSLQVESMHSMSSSTRRFNARHASTSNLVFNKTNKSCVTSNDLDIEYHDDVSTDTVVDEVEVVKIDTVQSKPNHETEKKTETDNCTMVSENTEESTPKEVYSDDDNTECYPMNHNDTTSIERKDMPLPRLRHHDTVLSVSDPTTYISETPSKELRPMSLIDVSSYRASSLNSPSPSASQLKNVTPPIINNYRVPDSTFSKPRQLSRPSIQILPSLPNPDLRSNAFSKASKTKPVPMDISSPKKTPPPLLPKPKFLKSGESNCQTDYREFDKILQDLKFL